MIIIFDKSVPYSIVDYGYIFLYRQRFNVTFVSYKLLYYFIISGYVLHKLLAMAENRPDYSENEVFDDIVDKDPTV